MATESRLLKKLRKLSTDFQTQESTSLSVASEITFDSSEKNSALNCETRNLSFDFIKYIFLNITMNFKALMVVRVKVVNG